MHNEDYLLSKYAKRIAMNFALLFSILFFPWWITLLLMVFGTFLFKNFYEVFFFGLFLDALYGTKAINVYGFRLFFAALGLFLLFFSAFLKRKVRFFL